MRADSCEILVVGAGASGLMSAISAARGGRQVLVLDHHPEPAKKLLATGNGKCNLTNLAQGCGCYRSGSPAFVMKVLERFSVRDTLGFFSGIGVPVRERQGYCYPRSGQASAVRDGLLAEAGRLGVRILCGIGIRSIEPTAGGFIVRTKSGDFSASRCVLAAGGKASPRTGSDGSGYLYAQRLGHSLIRPLPSLVPLLGEAPWLKTTAGVRCDASVSILVNGEEQASDTGEVQLTEYGISGIPVFQVSRFASRALDQGLCVEARLDFLPEMEEGALTDLLSAQYRRYGTEKTWQEILGRIVNTKIAAAVCGMPEPDFTRGQARTENRHARGKCRNAYATAEQGRACTDSSYSRENLQSGQPPLHGRACARTESSHPRENLQSGRSPLHGRACARTESSHPQENRGELLREQIVREQAGEIAARLKSVVLPIIGTRGFAQAQATSGGIPLDEIRGESMESRLAPGLYFAGEIVDVDGICGGYNLQWAWSSGYAAGSSAAESLNR